MSKIELSSKPFYLTASEEQHVRETLAGLTEEQKVGQLFCVLGNSETQEGLIELVEQ